jgi:hypothetical protein
MNNLQIVINGKIGKNAPIIGNVAHPFPEKLEGLCAGYIFSLKGYCPFLGWGKTHDTPHGRAFPGTVSAEETYNLSPGNSDGNIKKNMA